MAPATRLFGTREAERDLSKATYFFFISIRPVPSSSKALRLTAQSLYQRCRVSKRGHLRDHKDSGAFWSPHVSHGLSFMMDGILFGSD